MYRLLQVTIPFMAAVVSGAIPDQPFGQFLGTVPAGLASGTLEVPNPSLGASVTYTENGSIYAQLDGTRRRSVHPRMCGGIGGLSPCCLGIYCWGKKRDVKILPSSVAYIETVDDRAILNHVTFHSNGTAHVAVRRTDKSALAMCEGFLYGQCCFGICWRK